MKHLTNFSNNQFVKYDSEQTISVTTPHTGEEIGKMHLSTSAEVDHIVKQANVAFQSWSALTTKTRVMYLKKYLNLVENKYMDELTELIMKGTFRLVSTHS